MGPVSYPLLSHSSDDHPLEPRVQDEKLRSITYRSHFWRYLNAVLGTLAVIVGLVYVFFEDTDKTARVWRNINDTIEKTTTAATAPSPAVTDKPTAIPRPRVSTSATEYHPGDRFEYSFDSRLDGYVSLWNITASGKAERIIPAATNRRGRRVIAGQRYASGSDGLPSLVVSGAVGVEQLLLLWCPQPSGHGFSALFTRYQAFEQDLRRRRDNGCIDARSNYRIVERSNPSDG